MSTSQHEPTTQASVEDDRRQAWVSFLRSTEASYAAQAAAMGEPITPLDPDERAAVAQLAASLGVSPASVFSALAPATRRSA
jgi:tellurite resistance protein